MAALGAIGRYDTLTYKLIIFIPPDVNYVVTSASVGRVTLPTWAIDHRRLLDIPRTGTLVGQVKIDGTIYPYVPVRLYYRSTGELALRDISDASGNFSFDTLDPDLALDLYVVVAYYAPGLVAVFSRSGVVISTVYSTFFLT